MHFAGILADVANLMVMHLILDLAFKADWRLRPPCHGIDVLHNSLQVSCSLAIRSLQESLARGPQLTGFDPAVCGISSQPGLTCQDSVNRH